MSKYSILTLLLFLCLGLKSQHVINFYIPACPHPSGISEINIPDLNIFPNPADEYIELKFDDNFHNVDQINILDATGKFICEIDISNYNSKNTIRHDIKQLNEGIYYISIKNDNKTDLHRFIKLQLP
ncbi:MAG: T9SS type A sorting domain-containing protein [Bacteroidales bacterium]|nr:T9SS type A sorting domain-containing protein [Bacteroidales bacterium]